MTANPHGAQLSADYFRPHSFGVGNAVRVFVRNLAGLSSRGAARSHMPQPQ